MEPFLIVTLMLVMMFLGMPVAFALGIAGAIGIYTMVGFHGMLNQVSATAYRSVASSTLAAIPMFIFMAEVMASGGVAREVFDAARKIVGRLPGGIAIATVFASTGFAAISGSTTASSATLAAITLPEFKKLGYNLSAATGVVAVAGTLASMIPPSINFIIYGDLTETSIGSLLIAGIIPGFLTATLYVIAIVCWAKLDPKTLPRGQRWSTLEKLRSLSKNGGFCLIVGAIFVSLYGGIATATEVAAMGASSALLYTTVTRRLDFQGFLNALARTASLTSMLMLVVIGAMIFGYFLTISRVPQGLLDAIANSGLSPFTVLGLIVIMYLLLGCIMETLPILLITLPLTFPIVISLGHNPIWLGVIIVKLCEIGAITPPFGISVFVVSATTGVPVSSVFRGTGYLLIFEFISLGLLLAFPALSLWLPSMMK